MSTFRPAPFFSIHRLGARVHVHEKWETITFQGNKPQNWPSRRNWQRVEEYEQDRFEHKCTTVARHNEYFPRWIYNEVPLTKCCFRIGEEKNCKIWRAKTNYNRIRNVKYVASKRKTSTSGVMPKWGAISCARPDPSVEMFQSAASCREMVRRCALCDSRRQLTSLTQFRFYGLVL